MRERNTRFGLDGARVVLGVTGGIAAYKAADLASKLVQAGSDVHVVMTAGAGEFIRPMTFQALTRNPVFSSVFDGWEGDSAGHVTLASEADAVLVAPATADSLARMAQGRAGDMLGAVLLATEAPIIVAPAMEHHMWHHPATQANLVLLRSRGVEVVEPESGHLASGASGDGRLAAVGRLTGALRRVLGRGGLLEGKTVVVTAGGTREAIDPVRYVGNRSSGRMGVAIAEAAVDAGARVILIAGPTVDEVPACVETSRIEDARDLEAAVRRAVAGSDVLVMAAAVADFRPAQAHEQKLKKDAGTDEMTIRMVKNPDIVAGVARADILKVGFAAETESLLAHAARKLEAKDLDLIVANDAVATIGSDRVSATLLYADGRQHRELGDLGKDAFARELVSEIGSLLGGRQP
jgi:phosphopantothenoylcysteine decarboxylase / phosphopantothenate---cysteine ligase